MAVLNPDHLLEQAGRLAAASGGGAPRQADLRRAISSAYYAVFHAIVTEAADVFVGKSQRTSPRYALVYRSIDHRSLRRICELIQRSELPEKYQTYEPKGGFGADLIAVASAVIELQEMRHAADYDPLQRWTISEAILAVAAANRALFRFRNASSERRKVFVSLIVFSPR